MPSNEPSLDLALLCREEYIEQAHFFSTLGDQIRRNLPTQDVLGSVREEILATTRLPLAIDFLLGELRHVGVLAPGMRKLAHYFSPFQCFIMAEAENEQGRFDLRAALEILRREAEYRVGEPTRQGLFLYQFETLCRHRLGYDGGLAAIADDPAFDSQWRNWILALRRQIGAVDVADLIYVQSQYYRQTAGRDLDGSVPPPLFGEREGRIALANRHKDPLILFASLHRQLGYPEVPNPPKADLQRDLLPQLARRLELLEARLRLVEEEQRGGIDLSKFYGPPSANQQ
ncbi:MAG: hypothetical protein JW829_14265 [Pirellulales bacterium]|nr:hypothetical protein [Pirellulales bacterium]